jgi:predicted alpha/beta superfamily hydrolase
MQLSNAHEFRLGGQQAWFHDEGFTYGPVHTYDALRLPGPDERARKVHVLLPWDYSESNERYPVVFMNDGHTAIFGGGLDNRTWHAADTVGELTKTGRIEPVIIVAVHPINRNAEYTHAPTFAGQPYGGLDTYARYCTEALKPWVDEAYRTEPKAARTAIVGSSHGGLAAFYTACRAPERFGLVGALSPSFWVGRGANGSSIRLPLRDSELVRMARPTLADPSRRPKVWIDWGLDGDGAMRGAREMAELLQQEFGYRAGRDLWVHEDAHGGHNENAWGYRFRLLMETFFHRPM